MVFKHFGLGCCSSSELIINSVTVSATPRQGSDRGCFFITLHETVEGKAVWTSTKQMWTLEKETRLEWSDIDVDPDSVNLGIKSIVVKVWFSSGSGDSLDPSLDATWGVYFSGLWCIGTHPPAHRRLPANALIFQMCGYYFSSASHIRPKSTDDANFIPRYLHLGSPDDCQAVKSYDTTLIGRLHRTQRALKQQDLNNTRLTKDLRGKGIDRAFISMSQKETSEPSNKEDEATKVNPYSALPSLRQTLFAMKHKQPQTRIAENNLQARIELLRIKIMLLKKERDRRKKWIENYEIEHQELLLKIEEKSSSQMHGYHNLAKEKAALESWQDQFKLDKVTNASWTSLLRQEKLCIIHQLRQIFPIGDLGGKRPTLRWITFPPTNEIRESCKDETQLSVVIGEAAHLIFVIARILDIPLRHDVHLMGSTSTIQDKNKLPHESEPVTKKDSAAHFAHGEFPLFVKGSNANEWSKFEYALYLLNKNVAQLRWQCELITPDLRPTLHNLDELLALGKDYHRYQTVPSILTEQGPPSSFAPGVPLVVLKNGRTSSSVRRGSSNSSSDRTSVSNADVIDCDRDEDPNSIADESSSLSNDLSPPVVKQKEITELADAKDLEKPPEEERQIAHEAIQSVEPFSYLNDMQTRTKALGKVSFQRPRTNNY